MKLTRNTLAFLLALAVGPNAFAQSNRIPGPSDYAAFSHFIASRNIFDPSRVPHDPAYVRPNRPQRHVSASAPYLSLVGIMSYNKGTFAFFNANDPDLRQVLPVSGKIAGYTVVEMSRSQVRLESADKKQTMTLKVGDVLRQANGKWVLSDVNDVPEATTSGATSAGSDSSTPAETPAATSTSEPNDILKRLMQLREKENQ